MYAVIADGRVISLSGVRSKVGANPTDISLISGKTNTYLWIICGRTLLGLRVALLLYLP